MLHSAHRNLVAHTCPVMNQGVKISHVSDSPTPKASSTLCQCSKDKRKHFWPSMLKMAANNQA